MLTIRKDCGSLIRELRKKRGWSQRDLAERLGRPGLQSQFSLYENGKVRPEPETLRDIANALAVPEAVFFTGETTEYEAALDIAIAKVKEVVAELEELRGP